MFWDRRTGNLRASFHDTHPEAVTQVGQHCPGPTARSTTQCILAETACTLLWPALSCALRMSSFLVPCPSSCVRELVQERQCNGALQVCFPQHGTQGADWLLSSSADGFINVMALGGDLDEEEAFRVRPFCTPDNCLQSDSAVPLPCQVLKAPVTWQSAFGHVPVGFSGNIGLSDCT